MGIPSYFSHLVKNYRKIIDIYKKNLNIDNILLDCNSIIYDVFQSIEDPPENIEKYIIEKVYLKIQEYITMLSPNGCIYIAFDGVAPIAKLEQQRNRRYKTQYEKELFNNENKIKWDKACITPGTNFMNKLNKYIKSKTSKHKHIIFSGSDIPGEGEHKMFNYMRENPDIFKKSTTIIYGLDADLIMLSLIHKKYVSNLYLFRETPDFIKSIDKTLEPNNNYLLNISILKEILVNELRYNNNISENNIIEDYIFICFLLGNDFLPHFPSLNIRTSGIHTLLNEYKKLSREICDFKLIENESIIWKNVRLLINNLSILEEGLIKKEYTLRVKRQQRILYNINKNKIKNEKDKQYEYLMTPLIDRRVEEYINIYENKWENRYYKALFDIDIDNMRKKQICMNYLEGLEWVFKYYTIGCLNWQWKYKYDYPPLLTDLLEFVPYFKEELIEKVNAAPIKPIEQLMYVLPSKSLNLLPNKVFKKHKQKQIYNYENKFKTAFCTYMWESHAILPNIDINDIISL